MNRGVHVLCCVVVGLAGLHASAAYAAPLKIELLTATGEVLARSTAAPLAFDRDYQPGDEIRVNGARQVVVRLGAGMSECLAYAPSGRVDFHIPIGTEANAYSPDAFRGTHHEVTARVATPAELSARRNLALNPYDQRGTCRFYPHATSNNECRNEAVFAARNVLDGNCQNQHHGGWPYESWGPDRGTGIWLQIDFGRPVTIDRLAIAARADFPHDSVWPTMAVEFSDGSRETISLQQTNQPQTFPLHARTITWLRFTGLDVPGTVGWRALTEVEAWGSEAPPKSR